MGTNCTFCFFTQFVCRYDQLDRAKLRHQRCVDVLREHFGYRIQFSSEQAFQLDGSQPIFDLLLTEIVGSDEIANLSQEEIDAYSTFCFVTVLDIPYDRTNIDALNEEIRTIAIRLEIDFEEGFPAKFPSRTRGIIVSSTGHEIEGCIYQ